MPPPALAAVVLSAMPLAAVVSAILRVDISAGAVEMSSALGWGQTPPGAAGFWLGLRR